MTKLAEELKTVGQYDTWLAIVRACKASKDEPHGITDEAVRDAIIEGLGVERWHDITQEDVEQAIENIND